MKLAIQYFLIFIAFSSCRDGVTVKPSALLRLDYPAAKYVKVDTECPFSFEKNKYATIQKKPNCGLNIMYPEMRGTIYITYQKVQNNNLDSLLQDAQKLAFDHTIKANSIPENLYVNPAKNVYGTFYTINGNAATQAEFFVTDSISHFLNGALYFEAKPNYDSIFPAAEYLREDMRHIMESIEWK